MCVEGGRSVRAGEWGGAGAFYDAFMSFYDSFVIKILFLSSSGLICRWFHLNRIKNKKVIDFLVFKISADVCRILRMSAEFCGCLRTPYTIFFISQ